MYNSEILAPTFVFAVPKSFVYHCEPQIVGKSLMVVSQVEESYYSVKGGEGGDNSIIIF